MKYELFCENCNKSFPSESGLYVCPDCKSHLQVEYLDSRIDFENHKSLPGIFRYLSRLPLDKEFVISMGEGNTPTFLLDDTNISGTEIWIKNESLNPTGTYKDRPASVSVSKAKGLGARGVVVASDGNAAPAVAAYAARGNMPCIVLMPEKTPELRYLQAGAYGARIILIDGNINDCLDIAKEVSQETDYHNCCTSNTVNPYQIEGNKTISFEISEQFSGVPDWVAVPVGGGGVLSAVVKGFLELKMGGMIDRLPRILAVQAANCAPFVKAFSGDGIIRKLENVKETLALTIALPFPPDGAMALDYLNQSRGYAISVSEEEIIDGVFYLSRKHGVLAEPSGAVSYSGLAKAVSMGIVQPGERCLALITGSGLKTIEVFRKNSEDIKRCSKNTKEILKELI